MKAFGLIGLVVTDKCMCNEAARPVRRNASTMHLPEHLHKGI